ncbi:hypothetical protein [Actinomadura violacea]|uniref:Uncharacterized protein n=1 Tax=Actinomadura violacea TaxID=2819934 RepID=A0ABS3RX03_9ACTN|nr:hypothetical protein [Actinomadura violacea]MBO2460540.1 hypothetical protein [Actinomadura violacea]
MDTVIKEEWDSWEVYAAEDDAAHVDETKTWVPPNLAALVQAVRQTPLCRWAPGTSHAHFHLCAGLRFDAEWSPAFVARSRAEGYLVFPRHPRDDADDVHPTLVTHSAREAAAELERLLADWHPLGATNLPCADLPRERRPPHDRQIRAEAPSGRGCPGAAKRLSSSSISPITD